MRADPLHTFKAKSDFQCRCKFAFLSVFNLLFGGALLCAAFFRETPEFWRNEGGFPILLRELVFFLFYPGLMLLGLAVLYGTAIVRNWRPAGRARLLALLACAVQWLLCLSVGVVFSWNNLNNLFTGTPLHQH